jgi:PPOX class probable F420-dependent enzyme
VDQIGDAIAGLESASYLSVTTFKRDGRGVATVVWFVVLDGKVYFRTPANTGKVKRLRHNPSINFFACDRDGRRAGPTVLGTARLFDPPSGGDLVPALDGKYGLVSRLYALTFRLPGRRALVVEITPH